MVVIQNERFSWAQFHPNSQRVLLGSEWQTADSNGGLEEWDLGSGEMLKELYPPFEYLKFAAYVLDGTHILAANWRTTRVDVVDADSGRIIGGRRISKVDHGGAFLVDPTGRYFTMQIPTSDKIPMWDVHSWIEQNDSMEIPGNYEATNVAAGPHGKFIAIANKAANSVDILDANSTTLLHRLPVDFPVNYSTSKHLLFDASGQQLAIVGQADPVRFHAQAWNISSQKTILSQRAASGAVKSVAFYDQELRVLVEDKRRWQVVDVAKDEFIWELPELSTKQVNPLGRPIVVQDGQLTSRGEKVVLRNSRREWEIWDIEKGEPDSRLGDRGLLNVHDKGWASPKGHYILALGRAVVPQSPSQTQSPMMMICDVRNGEQNPLEQLGALRIEEYHWSQDENRLLVVAKNESWLIDVTTGRELLTLQHRRPLTRVDFSTGQRILAVTDKGRVNVWNGVELTSDTPQHVGLLADLAWDIVLDPNSGTEKVLRAVELAQEARDRSVGVAKYEYILGAAHYRAGNHRVAAEKLASLSVRHALWMQPRNVINLRALQRDDQYRWFLAMAQWKLGEEELAMDILDATYVSIVEDERLCSLAGEAAQLLGSSFDEKLQDEQDRRFGPSERAAALIEALDRDGDETISKDEMQEFMRPRFAEFDIDKSGAIDREELIKNFLRRSASEQIFSKPEERASAIFSRYDDNGDERLTDEELSGFIWSRYRAFDSNGDGSVDRDEFIKGFERTRTTGAPRPDMLLRGLDRFFDRWDGNGDGVVTEEEAPSPPWKLYGPHDANGDGKLERDEVRKSLEAAIAKQDE